MSGVHGILGYATVVAAVIVAVVALAAPVSLQRGRGPGLARLADGLAVAVTLLVVAALFVGGLLLITGLRPSSPTHVVLAVACLVALPLTGGSRALARARRGPRAAGATTGWLEGLPSRRRLVSCWRDRLKGGHLMGAPTRVLIAGESWVTHSIHQKGFDAFTTTSYHEGVGPLRAALETAGFTSTYLPNHVAATDFPGTAAELAALRRRAPQRHRRQHAAAAPGHLRPLGAHAGPPGGHRASTWRRRRAGHGRRLPDLPGHRRPGALGTARRSRLPCR